MGNKISKSEPKKCHNYAATSIFSGGLILGAKKESIPIISTNFSKDDLTGAGKSFKKARTEIVEGACGKGDASSVITNCDKGDSNTSKRNNVDCHKAYSSILSPFSATVSFKNVRSRIISFCCIMDLQILEAVCKLTNNDREIKETVEKIRRGTVCTNSSEEIAEIKAAVTHLCYMTENLTHKADIHRRNLFIRWNACEVVAQLLRVQEHYCHPSLIEEACWAVHHLARETEGKSRMVKEKVHTIICDILSNPDFTNDSGVQRKALGAVINLSNDNLGLKMLLEDGVCKKIVATLKHPPFAQIRELQLYGLWCIFNLASSELAQQPLAQAGAISVVIHALNNPVIFSDHSTLEIALAALRNLTSYASVVDEIIVMGGHKRVLELCSAKQNKDIVSLHEQALWAMMHLASSAEAAKDFLKGGVSQFLCHELTNVKFMSEACIVDPIVGIIYNMLRDPEAEEEFISLDILKHVKLAVERFRDHEDITQWGTLIIKILETSESNQNVVTEEQEERIEID